MMSSYQKIWAESTLAIDREKHHPISLQLASSRLTHASFKFYNMYEWLMGFPSQ